VEELDRLAETENTLPTLNVDVVWVENLAVGIVGVLYPRQVGRHELEVRTEHPLQRVLHDLFLFHASQRERVELANLCNERIALRLQELDIACVRIIGGVFDLVPRLQLPRIEDVVPQFHRHGELCREDIQSHVLVLNRQSAI